MNMRKAAVVGCGSVGASIAFCLMQRALFGEMVLIDKNKARAEGEAMDLGHGAPFAGAVEIRAGDYRDARDAAMMIVAAGAAQRPGQTRLDLAARNARMLDDVLDGAAQAGFDGMLLIVTNPVDTLTFLAHAHTGFPASRVLGSGAVLDTARLKFMLGRRLGVDSRNIHAFVIGEHGDSELCVWSSANVSGIDLRRFLEMQGEANGTAMLASLAEEVRRSAYEIIRRKGNTCYGVAMAVARIAQSVVRDEKRVLPVSTVLGGEYGLRGVALSVPAVVGCRGVERVLEIPLDGRERAALDASAGQVARAIAGVCKGKAHKAQ